jgi:hypothetical protein
MNRQSVFIGIPSHRATTDLKLTITFGMAMSQVRDYPLDIVSISGASGTEVDEARNGLMQDAIDAHADWLLMLDDDVWFGPLAPWELLDLALARGATVAGLPAPTRMGWLNVEPREMGSGFEPCDRIGGAVMAVNLHRVVGLGLERPWFVSTPQKQGGVYSEDFYFCDNVRAAGGSVFADWRNTAGNGDQHL